MNLRIHIFSIKMSWFYVVSGASEVWSWLLLIFDWLGWRRKKWQLVKAFPLSVTSTSALCHLRNDGTSAIGGRIHPLMDTCPFFDLIRKVVAWWEGAPVVSIVAEIWLTSSCVLHLLRFVCGLAWPWWALQMGFANKLAWAWLTLQDE